MSHPSKTPLNLVEVPFADAPTQIPVGSDDCPDEQGFTVRLAPQPDLVVPHLEESACHLAGLVQIFARVADAVAPQPGDLVGTPYVARRLGCTTVWVTEMIKKGRLPKNCVVPGTGSGKPWRLYKDRIDRWIETRDAGGKGGP
jgi:hypothetical protein